MTQYIGQITVIIDAHDESIAETQFTAFAQRIQDESGDVVFADHNGDVENYEEIERECHRSLKSGPATSLASVAPRLKTQSMIQVFTVMMHSTLVNELDEGFSPMDGLVAIDQMFSELPLLHAGLTPKRNRNRPPRKLRVYRGCYDWYQSLGFSYVQVGTTLHVLELWDDQNPNLNQVDVVLGTGRTQGYEPFADQPSDP